VLIASRLAATPASQPRLRGARADWGCEACRRARPHRRRPQRGAMPTGGRARQPRRDGRRRRPHGFGLAWPPCGPWWASLRLTGVCEHTFNRRATSGRTPWR